MARALPPLTWFRAFEAAARHLNFTAAADEIGVTQSAVSQQVRALETRLRAELFLRLPRGLALTDDGRKLLPKVGAALETLAGATEGFDLGPTANLLTVATSVSVAQWLIAPNLAAYQTAHPGQRIRLISTIWPDDFKASMAEVEIRFGSEKQVGAGAHRLGPDGLVAVAAPGAADLETASLIEAVGTSDGWTRWAEAAGRTPRPADILVDSHGFALDLAVQGAGIALTSILLAAAPLAQGRVRQVHAFKLDAAEGYFIAVRATSAPATAFAAWLADMAMRHAAAQ